MVLCLHLDAHFPRLDGAGDTQAQRPWSAGEPQWGGQLHLPDDELTTDDCGVSQVLMRNPSVLTGTRYDDGTYPRDAAQ